MNNALEEAARMKWDFVGIVYFDDLEAIMRFHHFKILYIEKWIGRDEFRVALQAYRP